MTICPQCCFSIPDNAMACPICMKAKYLAGLYENELELLPKIVAGGRPMKLLKAGRYATHIGYQDGFSREPYCGISLKSARPDFCTFADRPKNVCASCISTLKAFLKKAGLEYHAGQLK